MRPIDPTPYVATYVVIVFVVPWLIYGSFVMRCLIYAQRKGIPLFSLAGAAQMRALRQTDSHAALIHRRAKRWAFIVLAIWFIGFAVMCLTLYWLHSKGVVSQAPRNWPII